MSVSTQRAGSGVAATDASGPVDTPVLWIDGEFVPVGAPCLPATTHALHYGSGVFEGIRSYATDDGGTAVFRLPEHLERMQRGARMLGIDLDVAHVSEVVLRVLRRNRHRDAYIRPLAWLGVGSMGLSVAALSRHLMVATMTPGLHLDGANIQLGVSGWRRNPATSLPPLKLCGGYVNSLLAKREVAARGFEEALFVDAAGRVVECTGANVFMVQDGRIVAVEHPDALAGITRETLLQLTGARSRAVMLDELLDADEVFVCGTAAEVAPVARLEDRDYAAGKVGREVASLYRRVVRGNEPGCRHWLTHA